MTDDSLPGGAVSLNWSKVSGPGAVTFTNPSNSTTGATFSAPGTYILKLTATDTNATTTSTVTVTVLLPNQVPIVNAGANQTIALSATAAANGSVTDDGLPLGSTIESKWSFVSGPGAVTFTSVGSPQTTASFSAPGTYVLRLSANDTDRLTSADVTITVLPPNQAPVVNAGADHLLAFPNTANLIGTTTDDGYPVGSSLALTWSKVSGPGTVTFSAPNALVTIASFSVSGIYALRLTANDSALTTSDDVVITVNQASVVSAGTEQTISLGQAVTLTGTATDDGIPVGSTVNVIWSKVSGPGDVIFAAPNSLSTTATFSVGGVYIVRLTASDSLLTSTDDVRINVRTRKLPPEYSLTFPGALVENNNPIQPALYISAPRPTTGRVEIAGLNFSQDFTVTGNSSVKISLPRAADLNTASDQVINKGIHITALDQITVAAVNYGLAETDSYFALPISELGSQYLVLSYPTGSGYGTQFALAATVNNTSVTITPSAAVGARAAGVPYTITLNQGDVYQLTTTQSVDLSGTSISANKKIAVFGSNRCVQVPTGDPACNYLVEQLPSLEYFGTSFLAYPLARRVGGDTYRFIASQNNTHVTVNGQLLATLNRGQVYQQRLTGGLQISADQPILVAQLANSTYVDRVPYSDPFMMLLPSTEQYAESYQIATPSAGFSYHWLNLIVPQTALNTISVDGIKVLPERFTAIGASGYAGIQIPLTQGDHFVAGNAAFGAWVYGQDNADGYGHPAGLSLTKLNDLLNQPPMVQAGASQTVDSPIIAGKIYAGVGMDIFIDTNIDLDVQDFTEPDNKLLALNLADFMADGRQGKFLVYAKTPTLSGTRLADTLRSAGYVWDTAYPGQLTAAALQQYDAVWWDGDDLDAALLVDYVKNGGNVCLLPAQTNGSYGVLLPKLNKFLNPF